MDGVEGGRLGEKGVDEALPELAEKPGLDIMLGVLMLRPPHLPHLRASSLLDDVAEGRELDRLLCLPPRRG